MTEVNAGKFKLPPDWSVRRIDEIARITTGSRNTQDRVEDGLYPFFVRSQEVERINTWSFDGEAVLTAGDGVGTGKVFHYINGKFDCHQRVYRIAEFDEAMDGFFFFKQFSQNFFDRIMSMTAKSSVDSVRREMIAGMEILVPPIEEQAAIAQALSDIDDLIASLDALIAKKRDIKQGAMQQLLTGKRRLPGFSEEWVRRPLMEVVTLPTGQVDPRKSPFCSMLLIGPEHIEEATGRLTTPNTAAEQGAISGKYEFSQGDIIYGKINPHLRKVALAPFSGICSADLYPLRPKEGVSGTFVSAVLLGAEFTEFARSLSARSGIPKINRAELAGFKILMPSTFAEQQAIASLIADVDLDLALMDQKIAKYRQVRGGAMQQLLTGRIRLT